MQFEIEMFCNDLHHKTECEIESGPAGRGRGRGRPTRATSPVVGLAKARASSESSDLSSGSASPERATSPPRGPDVALERGGGHVQVNMTCYYF